MINQITDFIRNHLIIYLVHKFYGVNHTPLNGIDAILGYKFIDELKMKDGSRFKLTQSSRNTIVQSYEDYHFNDVFPNDIFLDVGANIGGVSIQVSHLCKTVFAVEPLFVEELTQNIILNKSTNIMVLPFALGPDGLKDMHVIFGEKDNRYVPVIPFYKLIKFCGGKIDFLKCDCEGGEYYIPLEELIKIPKIEMEVHNVKDMQSDPLCMFLLTHYDCTIDTNPNPPLEILIHARQKRGKND